MYIKHGQTIGTLRGKKPSRTYKTWQSMKDRCLNPNNTKYSFYGAVGIVVCDRWLDFDNFYQDMGERPKGKSLDRLENSKIYSKETCKWSTQQEQVSNRKPYGKLKIRGVYKTPIGNYQAKIVVDKKVFYLGTFICPLLASAAFENKHNEVWN